MGLGCPHRPVCLLRFLDVKVGSTCRGVCMRVCVGVCANAHCWPAVGLWFRVGDYIINSDHRLTDLSLHVCAYVYVCVCLCMCVRRRTVNIISVAHIDSLGWLRRTVAN